MVVSPCRGLCRISDETGWCYGCLRTLDEIAEWRDMDDQRKADVLLKAANRQQMFDGENK